MEIYVLWTPFFRRDSTTVAVALSCVWNHLESYEIVDTHFDVLGWHNVAADIAADHPNPNERHLVIISICNCFNFDKQLHITVIIEQTMYCYCILYNYL